MKILLLMMLCVSAYASDEYSIEQQMRDNHRESDERFYQQQQLFEMQKQRQALEEANRLEQQRQILESKPVIYTPYEFRY